MPAGLAVQADAAAQADPAWAVRVRRFASATVPIATT
jgi:hypothetical protein